MKKNLSGTLTIIFMILLSINLVMAADFSITKVEVDDIEAFENGDSVFVERGKNVDIEVFIDGNGSSDNVKVKAWVGGYEFGDIEDESNIFEVENNVDYRKSLRLFIPEDLDASDDYTLHIEVFDDDNEVQKDFVIRVQERRHLLNILDVILRPSKVEAGRALFTTVRVENLGDKKEEDILVNVAIPELGVSARDYIDELITEENTNDDDEETSASSNEIFLRIPEDAKEGTYTVEIEVTYNRGHDTVTEKTKVLVEGVKGSSVESSLVQVDEVNKDVDQGGKVTYNVMVANMASETTTYRLKVEGESLWATSSISPLFVTAEKDKTAEFDVTLDISDDANPGRNNFVVKVLSGNNELVEEISLSANVQDDGIGAKKALTIVFGVLVVLLIILGLVVAFNKMRESDGEPEEGGTNYY
tara:strand:- start:313 stop:1563 length:1251 start_codon:yes stop_codon:yes gene_type:complete